MLDFLLVFLSVLFSILIKKKRQGQAAWRSFYWFHWQGLFLSVSQIFLLAIFIHDNNVLVCLLVCLFECLRLFYCCFCLLSYSFICLIISVCFFMCIKAYFSHTVTISLAFHKRSSLFRLRHLVCLF